ncbi:MAG: tetratricopeptide repeat protein, partial [Bradymonadaceae bacterium]
QKLKDEARVKQDKQKLQKARKRYAKAAEAYKTFLQRFPDDKDIYRWNFYYADTLYYSGQYRKAYQQYRVVRELDIKNNKFQADAAFNAVKSLEFRLKKRVDAGKLPAFVVPEGSRKEARQTAKSQQKRKDQKKADQQNGATQKTPEIEPKEIPRLVKRYITAMDRYVILGLDYEKQDGVAAKFAFNVAKLFYDFKHYDTARKRFDWIVNNYPDREEAYLAASLMLETYRQEKKYDKMVALAERMSGVLTGEQRKAVQQEATRVRLGAKFKAAEDLFNQEKYEKAAKKYIELVNEAPDHKNAPRALNNAAVAYEEIKKYASAMKLYERVFRDYTESPLSGYALYRVGVNSERFFEFANAVDKYMLFYEKYEGKSPKELEKMGFQIKDKRPKALLSSAVLSENLQRYRKAAGLYEQFVEEYPNNDEAPNAQWQAVEAWKKAEETDKMIAAFKKYKRKFGPDPDNADKVLEGMMRIAKHAESQGRDEEAAEKYKEIIATFKKRETKPGSDSAYYAAKAQFQLAERMYQEWKKIKIEGALDEQKKKLDKKIKKQKKVAAEFKKVWEYKNL